MSAKDFDLQELEAKADEILSKSQAEEQDLKKSEEKEALEEKDVQEKEDIEKEGEQDLKKGEADKEEAEEKQEEDEAKDDDEAEVEVVEESAEEVEEDDEKEMGKSIKEMVEENETIKKSHEVSPFLQEWSRVLTRALESMQETIEKSIQAKVEDVTTPVLVKSMKAMIAHQEGLEDLIKSQKKALEEQSELIKSLQERLENIEKQPMPRKSVVNVVEKSFAKSAGIEEGETLSKAQIASRLEKLAREGKIDDLAVIKFDTTGQLDPEIEQLVKNMK